MNNFSTNTESFYLMSDTIYENYTFKSKSLITIEKEELLLQQEHIIIR